MNIIVDENIPLFTVNTLRNLGHNVLDIRGTSEEGIADQALWLKAQQEERLLITTDKGFAKHRDEYHYGIIIIRLKHPNQSKIHKRVMQAIHQFENKDWSGLLIVMRDSVQAVWKSKP